MENFSIETVYVTLGVITLVIIFIAFLVSVFAQVQDFFLDKCSNTPRKYLLHQISALKQQIERLQEDNKELSELKIKGKDIYILPNMTFDNYRDIVSRIEEKNPTK